MARRNLTEKLVDKSEIKEELYRRTIKKEN